MMRARRHFSNRLRVSQERSVISHVIDYAPGAVEQKLRHLGALKLSCECALTQSGQPALRLRLPAGAVLGSDGHLYDAQGNRIVAGEEGYRTWKNDHGGRLVGDWPLPAGMTTAQVGNNAVCVVELTEEAKKEVRARHKYDVEPYEVGVIARVDAKSGELTYSLTHDFFAGGYGLEDYVGKTVLNSGRSSGGRPGVKEAHGDLLMYYQMMCAKLAAQEAGHDIEFAKQDDGSYVAVADRQSQGLEE